MSTDPRSSVHPAEGPGRLETEAERRPDGPEAHRAQEAHGQLTPAPRRGLPSLPVDPGTPRSVGRVVGPGRIERGYLERIEALQRTVETAELLERGSARLLDRVEGELEQERASHAEVRQQANRMLVTLGALQKENEALRAQVLQLEGGAAETPALGAAEAAGAPSRPIGSPARKPGPKSGRADRSGRRERRGASRPPGFWSRLFGGISREP